jgi:hypothetical protein
MEWPECEVVPITDYETMKELMLALETTLPTPCILSSNDRRTRYLVTKETKLGILQGMMLALDHRRETSR